MINKFKSYACRLIDLFSYVSEDLVPMSEWERFYGGGKSIRERARTNVYNNLKVPKVIKWYNGLKFMIHPNNDISRALFTSGTYEPNSLLVVKSLLSKGSIFFDIGANAGVFTLAASQWVGPEGFVVAFEPSTREHKLLEENVSLNSLSNVRLEKLAISEVNGSGQLHIAIGKHNGQNTLCQEFAYEGVDSGTTETVFLKTLDQYVLDKGIPRIDLIKLDIEGAEYDAFQGAKDTLTRLRPAIMFEMVKSALQKNGINVMEIETFLNSMNYKICSIDDQTAQLVPTRLFEMKDGNAVALPAEKW